MSSLTPRWLAKLLTALALVVLACDAAGSPETSAEAERHLHQGKAGLPSSRAISSLEKSASLFEAAGNPAMQAEALYWLATAHRESKNPRQALASIQRARSIHGGKVDWYDPLNADLMIGELQTQLGHFAAARATIDSALEQAVKEASRWNEWRGRTVLAQLEAKQGRVQTARAAWQVAYTLANTLGPWNQGQTLQEQAAFEAQRGVKETAHELYVKAVQTYDPDLKYLANSSNYEGGARRMRFGAAQSLLGLARLHESEGNYLLTSAACAYALALMAPLPTTAKKDETGLEWGFGPRQNRALISELEEFLAPIEAKLEAAPSSAKDSQWIHIENETKVVLEPQLASRLRELPGLLLGSLRIIPEQKNGMPIALRLFGIRKYRLWGALGFQNGDSLRTIHGQDASAVSALGETLQAMRHASSTEVSLERRGKPMVLTLSVRTGSEQ